MTIIDSSDIRVFADIATDFKETDMPDGARRFCLVLNADDAVIEVFPSGKVQLSLPERRQDFSSFRSLLASEKFADLRQWAANQVKVVRSQLGHESQNPLPVRGELTESDLSRRHLDTQGLDAHLRVRREDALHVLVLDGPAGIGKTSQLRQLALARASSFLRDQDRLILHVESRGRNLQMLDDLIAGSLQRIRAKPTFDQLRVLVKHGLVTLALDGFDEFADPSGFQLAWAQLGDLLDSVSGSGQVILSGRETLVSRGRLLSELPKLSSANCRLDEFQLQEVDSQAARSWLEQRGVPRRSLDNPRLSEALRPGSYGLRPFFLSQLASSETYRLLNASPKVDILPLLIDALLERELEKLSSQLVDDVGRDATLGFLRNVCEEIARDMADNQSDSLPGVNVEWSAELCLPEVASGDYSKLLIHHATRLPFLSIEDGSPAVRFSHRQFFVFFLGANVVSSIGKREVPKYFRRNVLGSEFLEAFPKVLLSLPRASVIGFRDASIDMLPELSSYDRSRGNAAALLLGCLADFPTDRPVSIAHVAVDELFLRGKLPEVRLNDVSINVLRAERADLSAVQFGTGCNLVTLNADRLTRVPESIPVPLWLELGGQTFHQPEQIKEALLGSKTREYEVDDRLQFDRELLERILRYRPFWLRDDRNNVEPAGLKIIEHPEWTELAEYLIQHDLVRMDDNVQAAGPSSRFFHFRLDEIRSHFGL